MSRATWRKGRYKSGLENKVADVIPNVKYETDKIKYLVTHTYNPDFTIGPNKYIEAKGRFVASDRAKHLHIKEQHPDVEVFFVFGNASNTLTKKSKTTYGEWATKYGFQWVDIKDFNKEILKQWKSTKRSKPLKELLSSKESYRKKKQTS